MTCIAKSYYLEQREESIVFMSAAILEFNHIDHPSDYGTGNAHILAVLRFSYIPVALRHFGSFIASRALSTIRSSTIVNGR